MGYVIAMAGKGGVGKTTIAALIVRIIKEKKLGSVLAIDADPNSNLAESLGLEVKATIGNILDGISAHPEKIPSGMPKDRFIEFQVQTAIVEADGFDLLTMGKPEGPGCYCYVNNSLRNIMGKLINDYDFIIIDNEAGLEHLSRRTTRSADALVIVSNASVVGLKAAKRIKDLTKDLEIKIKKSFLIVNCYNDMIDSGKIQDLGLNYLGSIPQDKEIEKICINGCSLMDLNDKGISLDTLRRIGESIWQVS
ncbi:MAG: AAA family ATPase [Candidatus Omnitrophica bacterium]|nr:AAA family ATPase [Candidatus Omnitrophota bacterium]